jgi:hypothetical protein
MKLHDLFDRGEDDRDVSILGQGEDETGGSAGEVAEATAVHRLLAANGEAAEALAAILRNYGFDASVRGPEETAAERADSWRVEARMTTAGREDAAEADRVLRELAAEHGAEYEGPRPSAR